MHNLHVHVLGGIFSLLPRSTFPFNEIMLMSQMSRYRNALLNTNTLKTYSKSLNDSNGSKPGGSCVRQVMGWNLRFSAVPLRTRENPVKPWFSVGRLGVHSLFSCKLSSAFCGLFAACCAQQLSVPTYKDSNYSFFPVFCFK